MPQTLLSRTLASRLPDGLSPHKAVAASVVAVGHVLAILAFSRLGPSFTDAIHAPPVQVVLVPAAAAAEAPHPPLVLESPRVELEAPSLPTIEYAVDTPPESSAITLAAATRPPAESGAIAGAPELVSEVEYLDPPRPGYPSVSRRLHEQGLVVLRVLVDERGRAQRVDVHRSSGHARLDQAALVAIERAEFKPYVANGAARRVYVLVPIEFALGRASRPSG